MKTVGNILWHFPFMGFVNAFFTYVVGAVLCLTVVGAPIGLGLMEYGKFLFAPYSRAMVDRSELGESHGAAWKTFALIVRVLYTPLGVISLLVGVVQVALLGITIVGIPLAVIIAKSLGTYFNPVNKKCVPQVVAEEIVKRKELSRRLGA